jgi:UDP-N-acetylglucosamine 2-epimerase
LGQRRQKSDQNCRIQNPLQYKVFHMLLINALFVESNSRCNCYKS